jgi:SNF2 family DNA or RNA helicase
MQPLAHQEKFSKLLFEQLKSTGYAYLAGKPRSGKTYTSILTMEMSTKISRVLVLTKKNAIPGWHKFTENNSRLNHSYYVTNYEQVGKLKPEDYDAVIIDESHNTGAFPKPSLRYKQIRKLCWNMVHIHLSGTAIVESQASIYHQMFISKFSPFKHKNFYDFHREFGEPYYIKAAGREINQYDKVKPSLMPIINQFTIYMTQEDAGIDKSIQAIDKLHMVELNQGTKDLYNKLQADNILYLEDEEGNTATIVCDTVMRLRVVLHQIESGIFKLGDSDGITYNMG